MIAMFVAGVYVSAVVGSNRKSVSVASSHGIDLPGLSIHRGGRSPLKTHPEVRTATFCGYCMCIFDSS